MSTLTDAQATYADALAERVATADAHDAPINAEIAALQATLSSAKDPTIGDLRRRHREFQGAANNAERAARIAARRAAIAAGATGATGAHHAGATGSAAFKMPGGTIPLAGAAGGAIGATGAPRGPTGSTGATGHETGATGTTGPGTH